jgi:hypothetical protein
LKNVCSFQNKVLSLCFNKQKHKKMTNFIKVSEAPKTKFQLKKAILNGSIIVFEKDNNIEKIYRKLDNVNCILKLWDGFRYALKISWFRK